MDNRGVGRVLIISHNSLSLHSNNGKTLTSLFGFWPSENVAQLYFQEEIPESISFSRFFRLTDFDVFKFFVSFGMLGGGGEKKPRRQVFSHYEGVSKSKYFFIRMLSKLGYLKILLRDFVYGSQRWCTPALLRWVNDFSPTSVFLVGGNYRFSFRVAREICRLRNVPLDIYITDNYILDVDWGWVGNGLRGRLVKEYAESFSQARNVFVIGEMMREEFSKCFKRDFVPIMNLVDFDGGYRMPKSECFGETVNIVYAGGLHLGRDLALSEFGKLASLVKERIGKNIKIFVYSFQKPSANISSLFEKYGVVYMEGVTAESLRSIILNADFLLHIESFEKKYSALTRLSVSTKIPEYLSCGVPLIAYGPNNIASIRIVSDGRLGLVITDSDPVDVRVDKFAAFIGDNKIRTECVARAHAYGVQNFERKVVGEKVFDLVNQ